MLAHSEWYETVQESGEALFEQLLDFDGDGIQEVDHWDQFDGT